MKATRAFVLLASFAVTAFAAGEESELDILWRTINFVIFAGLVYWLFAGFIKKFFGDRTRSIVTAFEKAQDKTKEARSNRENAAALLEEAKANADSIVKFAKDEAFAIADRSAAKTEDEIKILHKLKDENKIVAENKMIRAVVAATMGEILSADDILSDQDAIVENLRKRVAI
jgi:F-type H+-transporting ATPase subunit b